jgi:hypothetical protein
LLIKIRKNSYWQNTSIDEGSHKNSFLGVSPGKSQKKGTQLNQHK